MVGTLELMAPSLAIVGLGASIIATAYIDSIRCAKRDAEKLTKLRLGQDAIETQRYKYVQAFLDTMKEPEGW